MHLQAGLQLPGDPCPAPQCASTLSAKDIGSLKIKKERHAVTTEKFQEKVQSV